MLTLAVLAVLMLGMVMLGSLGLVWLFVKCTPKEYVNSALATDIVLVGRSAVRRASELTVRELRQALIDQWSWYVRATDRTVRVSAIVREGFLNGTSYNAAALRELLREREGVRLPAASDADAQYDAECAMYCIGAVSGEWLAAA